MQSPTGEDAGVRWGWANFISLARLLMAPLSAWLIVEGRGGAALVVYLLAIASDFVDGPLARRRGEVSAFGALLDHGSDAIFVSLGVGALVLRELAPAPLPFLIALAFAQYALDSKALSGRPLRASALGRYNGIAYFVLLGTPLIRDALSLGWPGDAMVVSFGWLLVATTLLSMGDRLIALLHSRQTPSAS